MMDILSCERFIKTEPINRGCSNDKKYYVETVDGNACYFACQTYRNSTAKKPNMI